MRYGQDSAARFREMRDRRGHTQAELARIIGVSRSTIAGIETGGDSSGLQTAVALADYFQVPLDWLLCREPPRGGPLVGRFVNEPDELAWLRFWRDMTPDERAGVLSLLGQSRRRAAK